MYVGVNLRSISDTSNIRNFNQELLPTCTYSLLPITRTLANSNQNRFSLDFRHKFTVILPSVTRTLDNLNLPVT